MKKDNALPESDPSDTPEDPPLEDTKPAPEATDLPSKEAQEKSEELVTEKKSAGGRKLLLFLFLLITGGAGYYYAQEMGVSIPFLSELRKPSVPAIKESSAPVSIPSKPTKTDSPASVIEQDKENETNPEETVKILRKEILSLKEELARVKGRHAPEELQGAAQPVDIITTEEESEEETAAPEENEFVEQEEEPVEPQPETEIAATPPPDQTTPKEELAQMEGQESPEGLQDTAQPTNGVTAKEESGEGTTAPEEIEFVEQEEGSIEPQSEMEIAVTPPPVPTTPRESSPKEGTPRQRSKEVQAYLDFIENMGNKLFDWVRSGWEMAWGLVVSRTNLGKENTNPPSPTFSR
jgi:hypothetical protein